MAGFCLPWPDLVVVSPGGGDSGGGVAISKADEGAIVYSVESVAIGPGVSLIGVSASTSVLFPFPGFGGCVWGWGLQIGFVEVRASGALPLRVSLGVGVRSPNVGASLRLRTGAPLRRDTGAVVSLMGVSPSVSVFTFSPITSSFECGL